LNCCKKPFEIRAFIDTIEDKQVYEELKKIMVNIRPIDDENSPASEQDSSDSSASRKRMRDLLECLRKIQKIEHSSLLYEAVRFREILE
jgi:uncharacterized Zn finger protein (UPF0148 family)